MAQPYFSNPYAQEQQYYAQNIHGQPAYGQSSYGQPVYGQPIYNQPTYGQPAYGQPTYSQPTYGGHPPSYGHYNSPPPGKRNQSKYDGGQDTLMACCGACAAMLCFCCLLDAVF